jgi:hypothetical protein
MLLGRGLQDAFWRPCRDSTQLTLRFNLTKVGVYRGEVQGVKLRATLGALCPRGVREVDDGAAVHPSLRTQEPFLGLESFCYLEA